MYCDKGQIFKSQGVILTVAGKCPMPNVEIFSMCHNMFKFQVVSPIIK